MFQDGGRPERIDKTCEEHHRICQELLGHRPCIFPRDCRAALSRPLVRERYLVVADILRRHPEASDGDARAAMVPATGVEAVDVYRAFHRLKALRRQVAGVLAKVDCLMPPTIAGAYALEQARAEPVVTNARLGQHTNFINLLDLAAVAVPNGMLSSGVGWGVTLPRAPRIRLRCEDLPGLQPTRPFSCPNRS